MFLYKKLVKLWVIRLLHKILGKAVLATLETPHEDKKTKMVAMLPVRLSVEWPYINHFIFLISTTVYTDNQGQIIKCLSKDIWSKLNMKLVYLLYIRLVILIFRSTMDTILYKKRKFTVKLKKQLVGPHL